MKKQIIFCMMVSVSMTIFSGNALRFFLKDIEDTKAILRLARDLDKYPVAEQQQKMYCLFEQIAKKQSRQSFTLSPLEILNIADTRLVLAIAIAQQQSRPMTSADFGNVKNYSISARQR